MVTIRRKESSSCGGNESTPCSCQQTTVPVRNLGRLDLPWTNGIVSTPAGDVPRIRTDLTIRDRVGTVRARWGVGRMHYAVSPGLYAAGNPGAESPVLVTANYKLSLDHLRQHLSGRDAWILVLDTKGINVWCAAGKGTFGTDELVRRVQSAGLNQIVSHRKLILPQLGAPGICAHQVKDRCGFRVIYGPVRAGDLPAFLDAGLKADPEMRRVHFRLRDRAVLIPVEVVMGAKYMLLAAAVLLLVSGLNLHGYTLERVRSTGMLSAALLLTGFLSGAILGPLLLPLLPGRAFALKGAILGALVFAALFASGFATTLSSQPVLHTVCWALVIPTLTSFTVMNFTGASTFTSLSGVLREMRLAVPIQIGASALGLGLWITGLFLRGGSV
jgi:acetyl-CoA decarbonylase/synthase complex subunit gamma